VTSAVVTSATHAEARSNGPCRAAFPAAESEREMRTMTETNGQVTRRRVAGKGIDPALEKAAPERVTSTTHVNVALPFAKLEVHEPSEHLLALTTLVQDLAALLARMAPGPDAEDLVSRAAALAAKIAGAG